jgi:polyisoprenyl-phosphate glycosyltransferase
LGVSAVIAAYNEEQTIARVVSALEASPLIDEIIVVSDGSTDETVAIARKQNVKTLSLRRNRGKGYAMRLGVEHAAHEVLFFVDGDMLNITQDHIESLLGPVIDDACDMNVGVRHRGPLLDFLHLQLRAGPVLSGIRVMKRYVFETVPVRYMAHYKIETALNYFCSRNALRQRNTVIRGLGHVIKEHKRGLLQGLRSRWHMSREVVLLLLDLYLLQSWRWLDPAEQPATEYDVH